MKIDEYISALNKCKLFSKLSYEDLHNLLNETDYKVRSYSKGDIIFTEDEECKNLSIILSGSIEIQKIDALGKVLIIAEFKDGNTFGENLIFGNKNTFPMTVISKTDTVIIHIQKDSIVKLCQKNADFLYSFLNIISNRAFVLSSKLKEVTLKTIRQKICEFLTDRYSKGNDLSIKLGMTKREWADKLGVQRPSLSRELINMKEEGLIDYNRDTIIIIDIEAIKNSNA